MFGGVGTSDSQGTVADIQNLGNPGVASQNQPWAAGLLWGKERRHAFGSPGAMQPCRISCPHLKCPSGLARPRLHQPPPPARSSNVLSEVVQGFSVPPVDASSLWSSGDCSCLSHRSRRSSSQSRLSSGHSDNKCQEGSHVFSRGHPDMLPLPSRI